MKIILTGATSMLASATAWYATSKGTEVVAIVQKNSQKIHFLPNRLVKVVACDVSEYGDLVLEKADCLMHFAWKGTDKEARLDAKKQAENINYTLDAVMLAKRCGCKSFLFAGSQAEYGKVDGEIFESTSTNPKNAYGICKLAAGMLSQMQCEKNGINHIYSRIFSVYGENDTPNSLISTFIEKAKKGEEIALSSCTQQWDFLHKSDAARALYELASINANGIYNIANGDYKPLIEYVKVLMNCCDYDRVKFDDKCGAVSLMPNIDKLKSAISFTPKIEFDEGIKELIKGL